MKKFLISVFVTVMTLFSVTNVAFAAEGKQYKVTFSYNGTYEQFIVDEGDIITPIENPTKEGYTFVRWTSDLHPQETYDFSEPVTRNTVLMAQWKRIKRSDLGELASNVEDISDITGVNPNETFNLTPEKEKINLLKRIDPVSISLASVGFVLLIIFFVIYSKEKKIVDAIPSMAKNPYESKVGTKGICHRCGSPYAITDKKCKKCGVTIYRR